MRDLLRQCEGFNFFLVVNYKQNIDEMTDAQLKCILNFKSVKSYISEEFPHIYSKLYV